MKHECNCNKKKDKKQLKVRKKLKILMTEAVQEKFFSAFEPKYNTNFIVTFPKECNIPSFVICDVDRPTYDFEKMVFGDMVFGIYDPVNPSTSSALISYIRDNQSHKLPLMKIKLEMLGPVGDVVERWRIKGKFKSLEYSQLSWDNQDPVKLLVTVSVDNAELEF